MTATAPDPLEFARQMFQLGERGQKLMAEFATRPGLQPFDAAQRSLVQQAGAAYRAFYEGWRQNPGQLLQATQSYWQDYTALWQSTAQRWMDQAAAAPVATAAGPIRDKRFAGEAWQQNAGFDFIKQSYLLTANWAQRTVAETPGLDAKTRAKIEFFTRQWVDAISPSNFWLTNPEALRQMAETNGDSLLQGLRNLLADIERGDGQLRISMTNPQSYQLGVNIAATPGQVVYRNRLMELIQYSPLTDTVAERPLLILPPWINKYYILDLREQNSFVRAAVAAGHTVFMVSWINPDARHAELDFEDYLQDGALAALDAVEAICGSCETNLVGYCLGGTLLACLLAYLKTHGQDSRVTSATYLTAMMDFSEPGDLGVFIDEAQITALEAKMFQQGYLEAAAMATTFNLLRANDLIWSFVVNNYLLGREPLPFDLLYWNADATNLPAVMHSTYLRQMYLNNRLCQPNGMAMLQTPLDLTQVATPTFAIAARDDHIAPWKSVYRSARLFAGPVTFVLAGSGHIAGIINPPAAEKYQHWVNPVCGESADSWLSEATETKGSWWILWHQWLGQYAGAQIPARQPGTAGSHPPLEAAPGSYVKVRAM